MKNDDFLEGRRKLHMEIIVNIRLLHKLYFWYRLFDLQYVCNFAVIYLNDIFYSFRNKVCYHKRWA